MTPAEVVGVIEHTLLRPEATRMQIEALCGEAAALGFVAVCINPAWVRLAARLVGGTGVRVCSVVGFPLGATTPDVKAYEALQAILSGAEDIDMVMNIGALKSGDVEAARHDIEAVTAVCRVRGVVSKVIIEAGLLNDGEKVAACGLAQAAGAGYVKTSTGFGPTGATVADVALIRRVVGGGMGIKAAGGVRDLEALEALLAAGATRIGTTAGLRIVQQARVRKT